ncbi:hypothetical protein ACJIZ3_015963 [Penstemon smallii]|uniref:Synergin gamma C-terminal domain-containing protein n=1 Tax=Penstemon smallii TaxID=265156 RepID=A0ABD3RUS4_9LAMI
MDMAEDDDDETFGEFSFATNGDDDEWGDFVKSPQQSKPPAFNSSALSPPRWEKPSGALPLSIFGDAEEEEHEDDAVANSSGRDESVSIENGSYSSSKKKSDDSKNVVDPDLFGGWTLELNRSYSNVMTSPTSTLDMNGQKQEIDGDDGEDGWQFKDAYSESKTSSDVDNKVDLTVHPVFGGSTYSPERINDSNKSNNFLGVPNGSPNLFVAPNESVDLFVPSNGIFSSSQEVDFTSTQPTRGTLNGFIPETNLEFGINSINGIWDSNPDALTTDYDEDFGEFTAASAETESIRREPSDHDTLSPLKDAIVTWDGEIEEKNSKSNGFRGPFPLSIFGNEESKLDDSSYIEDTFVHQSTSDPKSSLTPTPVISVNDLISSLYSQAEQPSISSVKIPTKFELNFSNEVSSSNQENDDDSLDDNSWDFKDAFSQTEIYNETSCNSFADPSISSKLKLNDCLDFYSKLKEELCLVAKCHFDSLKQSRSNAAVSGEDARIEALDSDLQLVRKELEQINILFEEQDSQDPPLGDRHLNELIEALLEPQFQILESEYQLSEKLLLVEKDLLSATELLRHTNTMLKILNIRTSEEQSTYISIWSDMISVCAQELRHGALIWNQAMEKSVQSHLLSERQGCRFILALGEIYRVVVVLGASAKLFKPWTLTCSLDSSGMYILLEECHTVWSNSGLEEALSNVSASLFDSIKHIRGLDALALQNCVFAEKDSLCWLSILTARVAPGLKMIMWGEEQCFVTLANLWANLISCNPPKLPRLNIG